jgi:hypothetical protein
MVTTTQSAASALSHAHSQTYEINANIHSWNLKEFNMQCSEQITAPTQSTFQADDSTEEGKGKVWNCRPSKSNTYFILEVLN